MAEISRSTGIQRDPGAYLGPGTKINGKLFFEGATMIEGEVEGEILVRGDVTLGEQANVKGKIAAASILIRGKATASIQAEKKVEIQPPGAVFGDITTPSLVIGDGAILEGHCSMKKEAKVLPLTRQEAAAGGQKEAKT
ncbi:MAG: polymer-forming cytoskeletal protein [Deltaproteobacteria bacterium]|nr:polymer-forming cytoskeletal protein [Deltaproteobacteria bacterium]